MAPVAVRAAPAERENSIKEFSHLGSGAIAQRAEIGNKSGVPEQHRNGEVGRDCEHVPEEWAAEVGPNAVVVRQRREIPRHPDTANVDAGENGGANHREKRHRFRGAIDRGAPFLPQQVEDGADERAGVTDTDPEYEVGDVPGPADGRIETPGADAGRNLIANAKQTDASERGRAGKRDPPPFRRAIFHRGGNAFCDPSKAAPVEHQRHPGQRPLDRSRSFLCDHFWSCGRAVHLNKCPPEPRTRRRISRQMFATLPAKQLTRNELEVLRLRFAPFRLTGKGVLTFFAPPSAAARRRGFRLDLTCLCRAVQTGVSPASPVSRSDWPRRSCARPASSDWDCECAPDSSHACSHSDTRAAGNCDPVLL